MPEQSSYVSYTATDYVIAYLLGSEVFANKCALIQAILPTVDDPVLKKISTLVVKAGTVPSLDYMVGSLGYVGSVPQLKDGINLAEFLDQVEGHQESVKKGELSRKLGEISKDIQNLSREDILTRLSKVLESVSTVNEQKKFDYAEAYLKRKDEPAGMLTFVKNLDDEMRGVAFGTMYTVGGFAGQGKTSFAISSSYGNSTKCGLNGVFLSFEMPKALLISYYLSRHSKHEKFQKLFRPVPKEKLIFANMNADEEKHILGPVHEDLFNNSEYGKIEFLDISDFSNTSFSGIMSRLMRVNFPIHYMVIDYAQKFKFIAPPGMDEPANRYVSFFNNMCMDFNGRSFSLMMLSQTNRTWYELARQPGRGGTEGLYPLTALAEINSLERDSTYVSFVYLNDSLKQRKEMMVNLPKNRYVNSFDKPVTIPFDPEFCVVGDERQGVGDAGSIDYSQLLLTNTLPNFMT